MNYIKTGIVKFKKFYNSIDFSPIINVISDSGSNDSNMLLKAIYGQYELKNNKTFYIKSTINEKKISTNLDKYDVLIYNYLSKINFNIAFKDLDDMSIGQKIFVHQLSILLSAVESKASLVCIEDVAIGLHPNSHKKIIDLFMYICNENKIQLFVTTYSPFVIGHVLPEQTIFIENESEILKLRYTVNHSIEHVLLSMGANPNDTYVINLVESYLKLIRKGNHLTQIGRDLLAQINALNLDVNSESMSRIDLSTRRFNAVGI